MIIESKRCNVKLFSSLITAQAWLKKDLQKKARAYAPGLSK